mgnify:FL=1
MLAIKNRKRYFYKEKLYNNNANMKLTRVLSMILVSVTIQVSAQDANFQTKWGDQGDGTYINPVLNSDYSDPDVIRVGKKYYMVICRNLVSSG